MSLTKRRVWEQVPHSLVITALVLGVLSLALGATRGLFSWDYFSLWGLYPKWIWSTGDFWTPATELPLGFRYESFFGSLLGWLLRLFKVNPYPDLAWGFVNSGLIVFFAGVLVSSYRGFPSLWRAFLFLLTVLFIQPPQWGQMTLGGYADLLSAVGLATVALGLVDKRLVLFVFGVWLTIFTRPVNSHWILWCLLAAAAARAIPRRFWIQAACAALVMWLAHKQLYQLDRLIEPPKAPLHFQLNNLTPLQRLRLPLAILLADNGLVIVALVLALAVFKRERFWLWLWGFGYVLMLLTYTFFMPATPNEVYPSINRYVLPFVMPILFALATRRTPAWTLRAFEPKAWLLLAGFFIIFARGNEEYLLYKRAGWWEGRSRLCERQPEACAEGDRLRGLASQRSEKCDVFVLPKDSPEFVDLVTVYTTLPVRIYFPRSQIPRGLRACSL